MHPHKNHIQGVILSMVFLILVPTVAHFLFSSLGFNPTDDGQFLAPSRRILEGQVPYRDFISFYPILTPIMHLPFVLWAGDYTYWFSRYFVWLQLACIAWIWTFIVEAILKHAFGMWERILLALISFAVSAHNFPIMAWSTIDGLFLISIGLYLCTTPRPLSRTSGYTMMSLAYLCKQSFLLAAPLALIVLGDWRKIRYWIAIAIPAGLYVLFLLLTDALADASHQLVPSQNYLRDVVVSYYNRELLLGIIAGYLAIRLAIGEHKLQLPWFENWSRWSGILALSVLPLLGIAATYVTGRFILQSSFGLLGITLGAVCYFMVDRPHKAVEQVRVGLLALIAAWSVSLSNGYRYPILASGQLLLSQLVFIYPAILQRTSKRFLVGSLTLCAVIALTSFGVVRVNCIYKDQPARNLTRELGQVLPGGKRIRTNPSTYKAFVDLRSAISVALSLGKTYSIIPDYAGYWVKSQETNPLPIDWTYNAQLWNKAELTNRIISALESRRDNNVAIVQKADAAWLAIKPHPLSDKCAIVKYVREHFSKISENDSFELYK